VRKTITSCQEAKNGVCFVAECDDTIVGHAFLEPLHTQSVPKNVLKRVYFLFRSLIDRPVLARVFSSGCDMMSR
jgi:hypothetical protein